MKNYLPFLILATVILGVANIFIGPARIPFDDVAAAITGGGDDTTVYIVMQARLPQMLTALLTGAALAVAGLLLQTVFHNPLASPSVLGISGGSALAVAVVTLCGLTGVASLVGASFAGAAAVTLLMVALSAALRSNLVLLIVGLLLGYLLSAAITILSVCASAEGIRGYVLWGMGDFSSVGLGRMPLYAAMLLLLMTAALLLVKPLNALQLGEKYAANLGVNVLALRNILLIVTGGITAVCTAFCGIVAFIGLAVPHLARIVCRSNDFRRLVPATLLCGAATALACCLLCAAVPGRVLPINAVTPVIGVPVIVYVLTRRRF